MLDNIKNKICSFLINIKFFTFSFEVTQNNLYVSLKCLGINCQKLFDYSQFTSPSGLKVVHLPLFPDWFPLSEDCVNKMADFLDIPRPPKKFEE